MQIGPKMSVLFPMHFGLSLCLLWGNLEKIYLSKINYKIKTNKGRVKSFAGLKLHYLQNMYTNLQVNRTKIEGYIVPGSGTDFLR